MADVINLIGISRLHILRWQARLGELRRQRGDPASRTELAGIWNTVAALIDLHMRAYDEICGPAICDLIPQGRDLARQNQDAHADIGEIIGETSLHPPGSPRWWVLARAALAAWAQQCDAEDHGPLAGCLHSTTPALRAQLARRWRAFNEARIRDLYPDAPSGLPTCQLRQSRPAAPRLADPAFSPLACTCQACTDRLDRANVA